MVCSAIGIDHLAGDKAIEKAIATFVGLLRLANAYAHRSVYDSDAVDEVRRSPLPTGGRGHLTRIQLFKALYAIEYNCIEAEDAPGAPERCVEAVTQLCGLINALARNLVRVTDRYERAEWFVPEREAYQERGRRRIKWRQR
jgi:hypothetical protein